jgi:hypothetical protein
LARPELGLLDPQRLRELTIVASHLTMKRSASSRRTWTSSASVEIF